MNAHTAEYEMVLAAQAGDHAAFTELFEMTYARVYHYTKCYVYHMYLDGDDQDDIVNAAYAKAYKMLHRYQAHKGSFGQWVYGIARNEARQLAWKCLRKYRLSRKHLGYRRGDDLPTYSRNPMILYFQNELYDRIWSAVEALPAQDAAIVVHRAVYKERYIDIGQLLNLPRLDVMRRYWSAVHSLEERFPELNPSGKQRTLQQQEVHT